MVREVERYTSSEEGLADALLDLVQDKGYALSIRYYPTTEYKYPVETLVEMGGDCDTMPSSTPRCSKQLATRRS